MDKIVFSQQETHLLSSVVFQSLSPDLTEVSLVPLGATYWMGSLKEPG